MNRRGADRIGPAGMAGMVGLWGASSLIESIQYGTVALSGATSNTATISSVDTTRSLVVHLGQSNNWSGGTQPTYTVTKLSLTNATTVTATRGAVGGIDCNAAFAVLQFRPGAVRSVQQGNVTPTGTATVTEVNTAKSLLLSMGISGDTGGIDGSWYSRLTLTNGTTVTATRQDTSASALAHNFVLVEFF